MTADYGLERERVTNLQGAAGIGPAVFAPLQSEAALMGLIMLVRPAGDGAAPFSPAEVTLLVSIGEMAGNALRRARLFDDGQRRLDRMRALRQQSTDSRSPAATSILTSSRSSSAANSPPAAPDFCPPV